MSTVAFDPAAAGGTVDVDNPWPGLVPFDETDHRFFRGRGREIEKLCRLVLRGRVTVLFGTSGLGKSSLLKAGLFPALRAQQVLPIYIRLDYSQPRPDLVAQIFEAVARQTAEAGAEAPPYGDHQTLWEYFHHRATDFWDRRNRPLTPMLVLDQFEELFTLGRRDAAYRAAGKALVAELSWLAEGRAPPALKARLEADPDAVGDYDFGRHGYKLLLSLREDYLADLEELRGEIPSLALNRLRLNRMTGRAALRVVWLGAPRLLDLGLADPVVRFVARAGPEDVLDEVEVEPALLSVVCRKLNDRRRAKGDEKITAGLLAGSQESILDEFYESSIRDLGPKMRRFIEDRLLTVDDHRDSIALGNALGLPGVTQEGIEKLVNRRLVRIEESAGSPRVELTHDLLVGAIAASRARRERRRRRFWVSALAAVTLLLLVGSAVGIDQLIDARRRAADERRMRIAAELADREGPKALSVLLELRSPIETPEENPAALFPALAASLDGMLGEDLAQMLAPASGARAVFVSADGTRVARVGEDHTIRVEAARGQREPVVLAGGGPVLAAAFSPDGARLAAGGGDGTTRVWSTTAVGDPVVLAGPPAPVLSAAFSPDGGRVATGYGSGAVKIWSADGSGAAVSPEGHAEPVHGVAFSPDGELLVTASEDDTARVWSATTGELVLTLPSSDDVWSAAFSPDGTRVVTASSDRVVRVWHADGIGEPLELGGHEGPVVGVAFTPGGSRIVSASVDGTARVWRADGYGEPVVLGAGGEPLASVTYVGDERRTRILTAARDGAMRVWPAAFDSLRDAVGPLSSGCLGVDFRRESLGEGPEEARRNHERCVAKTSAGRRGS